MRICRHIFILLAALALAPPAIFSQTPGIHSTKYVLIPSTSPPPLPIQENQLISQFINYFQGRGRAAMEKEMSRSGAHIKIIQQIFREEGIPEELAVIPQVFKQLGGNTRILWGISPGKTYGLRLNAYINENSSFEKATRAAAQYLCDLYKIHGNWELALAAFYSGENNLNQAIKKAGTRKFWIVYNRLDRETRNFVPSVYAAVMIARNPAKYGFDHVEIAAPIQYDSVRIPANTDLSLLAPALGTSLGDLRNLNPEYRNNFSPPEPYILRVPPGTGQAVLNFLKEPYKTQ